MSTPTNGYEVRRVAGSAFESHLPALVRLLSDAVESGASVGFLAPLREADAWGYWDGVRGAINAGTRILLVAIEDGLVLGVVQLDLAAMPNGSHRAEVMKLLVLRTARRRGIARTLMAAVEDCAREAGRNLLVLDTRLGDTAEGLYERIGYTKAGVIPRYARSSNGGLDGTAIMYRWLES
jgi:acetyltransferase